MHQSEHSKVYSSSIITDNTYDHPTPKPVPLLRRYVEILDAQRVLDPFAGSGTTMVACEQLGPTCYAMEIEPRYVDTAIARWEQYTGGKAELWE